MSLCYAELHCKTNFSFLEGASHADELVQTATQLDYTALAITDRNSLSGVVRAHTAAKETGLKLLVGAEMHPDDAPPVVLWAMDRAGYGQLARLITVGRRRAPKGECHLHLADIADHHAGLLAGVIPIPNRRLHDYYDIFGDRGYLLAHAHRGHDDSGQLWQLHDLSQSSRLPLVAAGDVHYHVPARMVLQDVLTAIRLGTTVAELGGQRFVNSQRHLRGRAEITQLYAEHPEAIRRTREITDRCHFSLAQLRYEYPEELVPPGLTPRKYLQRLTWEGARRRYPEGVPDKVRRLLDHELELIFQLKYETYFLTVWDLVRFARSREILCQGRGSAANSAVCYCLGVTAVDPSHIDLLFERFVSRERDEAPDIDVDFEHERREEVIQYVYDKYGRERSGMTAEVITYRIRSAVRDAGKALGISQDRIDALAKHVEGYHHDPNLAERCQHVGMDPDSEVGKRLVYVVEQLLGFPRHLSQHVGGLVITHGPLSEMVPIENAAMPGRTVISWDKNDLDALGILKVDCLGLGMLTAIRKAFQLVAQHANRQLTLANIPPGDPDVYNMISQADTMGVFQIESRAQMSMLPRLRPQCFYDLVIEVAIVRPGPIQGQMVHPYLRRRAGEEPVTYATDAIRHVLEKTLGVPIFQEQAMRLAVVAAGFTPGEADQLRRAMGAWRRPGIIDNFRQRLIEGMQSRGLGREFAERVFQQIRGFGEYGFPESHAASFALLVYVSAWLKFHYPAAFAAAIINSQPMGFYAPAQLVRDARDHGVPVRPIDVNHSDGDCTLESSEVSETSLALRLGLRLIVGLATGHAETLVAVRRQAPFTSQEDLARRTGLGRAVISRLARADALASLGRDRRQSLWEAMAQDQTPRDFPLFRQLRSEDEPPVALPELAPQENVFADYATTGLSLKNHPLAFCRQQLTVLDVCPAEGLQQLSHDQRVTVAGIVLLRQRPSTAKGITFVTLEDETGTINLVLYHSVWHQFYTIARRSPAWLVRGRIETKHTVIHVVVQQIEDLGDALGNDTRELQSRSRDFR